MDKNPNRILFRRNVVNIFLYVAERSRYYYPAGEIPEMLETFIPLITQEVCWHFQTPGGVCLSSTDVFDYDSGHDFVPSADRYPLIPSNYLQNLGSFQFYATR